MRLDGLPPGMQDQRKADFTAQNLATILFQQLGSRVNEVVIHHLLIPPHQRIEHMIDREHNMIIRNGQDPYLLRLQPLRLFKGTTFGTVSILAGFVLEFPTATFATGFDHPP